ncbi:hypothetical protein [Haloarcula sp. CGMCC 1.6347]|uniref:hypothetical protein n=1 Tax=Haloarcula sp. CGMCC 1.6347 TaxID=3111455 RepID=UPI00300F178F
MSELTDALITVLGPETGLILVILLGADWLQTRYLSQQVGQVRDRVKRVEAVHLETDGGVEDD